MPNKGGEAVMKVEGIDHVNILVKDLEAAMDFFCDVFGSKFIGPIDHQPQLPIRIAVDNVGFALQSPTSRDHPFAKQIDERGEGVGSIAVKVSDIDEGVAELKAKGLRLVRMPPEQREIVELPSLKSALFSGENAFGVQIELVQYDAPHPAGIGNLGMLPKLPWFKKTAEPIMQVERIDHIHVLVKDMEAAMSFFSSAFGSQFIFVDHGPHGVPLRVAFDNLLRFELQCTTNGFADYSQQLEECGEGVDRIGFNVSNIEGVVAGLVDKGLKAVFPVPLARLGKQVGQGMRASIFAGENAFGVPLEVVEFDTVLPVAIAHLGMTSELPWFKG